MSLACVGLSRRSRLGQLFLRVLRTLQPQPIPQPQIRCMNTVAQPAAGAEGPSSSGRGGGGKPWRSESVNFVVPEEGVLKTINRTHLTQDNLENIIFQLGAVGFLVAGGAVSQQLEDLPDGGTVKLVMPYGSTGYVYNHPLAMPVWPRDAGSRCPASEGGRSHSMPECMLLDPRPPCCTSCLLVYAPAAMACCLLPCRGMM